MQLFATTLLKELPLFHQENVRLRFLGDLEALPKKTYDTFQEGLDQTADHTGMTFALAVNYGSRAEIVRAVNTAVEKGERVTEESFKDLLYTHGMPDPELMIRTGKEIRLSNFLLYQSAYTELYFTDTMFPAFSDKELEKAIVWYSSRTRRFGKTDEQLQE
jgi:undecaprenyl diphosphate synthase